MNDRTSRLIAVRKEMATFGMDGFIVPRADEHQGEYVAPCSERLAWLTGFTGSAGSAIILSDRAAVFVDGRYTLQAETEVSADDFDHRHVTDSPAPNWLKDHLKEGMQLSYDPWLHTGPGLHRIKEACEKMGAKLVPAPHNFIDAVWADRPAPPPLHPSPPMTLAMLGKLIRTNCLKWQHNSLMLNKMPWFSAYLIPLPGHLIFAVAIFLVPLLPLVLP